MAIMGITNRGNVNCGTNVGGYIIMLGASYAGRDEQFANMLVST